MHTIELTTGERRDLRSLIEDGVLQDGWFEMDRPQFDAYMQLLKKLGGDTETWEKRYYKMESNLL